MSDGRFRPQAPWLLRIPWWLHGGLAAGCWFALPGWLQSLPADVVPATGSTDIVPAATAALLILACLSLLRSLWRRWRLRRLASLKAIARLSWQDFESLTGELYRRRGFRVEDSAGAGADGGIDLVLRRGEEKTLVQCKHWKTKRVGVAIARELRGLVASEAAAGGVLVTSGEFTADARAYAENEPLELVDGAALAEMIRAS